MTPPPNVSGESGEHARLLAVGLSRFLLAALALLTVGNLAVAMAGLVIAGGDDAGQRLATVLGGSGLEPSLMVLAGVVCGIAAGLMAGAKTFAYGLRE